MTLKASQAGHRKIQHAGMKDLDPVEHIVSWVSGLVRSELKKNNPDFVIDT